MLTFLRPARSVAWLIYATLSHQSQFSRTIEPRSALLQQASCAQDDSRRWLEDCAPAARARHFDQTPSPCPLSSLIRFLRACQCGTPFAGTLPRACGRLARGPVSFGGVAVAVKGEPIEGRTIHRMRETASGLLRRDQLPPIALAYQSPLRSRRNTKNSHRRNSQLPYK
jgi:hypothetical protein